MDENKIIEEIKNGNSEAFNALYEEYYLKLYNYIFRKDG